MDQVVLGGPPWTKGGHGFNNVAWWDDLGVPLAHGVVPMHYPESKTAVHVSMTSSVTSARCARASRRCRVGGRGLLQWSATPRDAPRRHHRQRARGLARERASRAACACGHGTQERDAWRDPDGTARVRLKGRCRCCGSITLLSGRWRYARNPSRFVPILPGDPADAADLTLGNPLTFRDRMAARSSSRSSSASRSNRASTSERAPLRRGANPGH
jgi:hypothetical protein